MVRTLVVGGGGREEAMKYSLAQGGDEVFVAPGNPGTTLDERCYNLDFDVTKPKTLEERRKLFPGLADLVEKHNINRIVVGPEQPLVDGIVDFFYRLGFNNIFGSTSAASDIEADKFESYRLMDISGVPQAVSILCSDRDAVMQAITKLSTSRGVVLKARRLTGGKGVGVYDTEAEASKRAEEHMKLYGNDVLVAERLFGQELSVFGFSDGSKVIPIRIGVQDHKRLLYQDYGPNTGGMGAFCPVPIADSDMIQYITDKMMTPIVMKMKEEGHEYKGFLYAAVIMTEQGPKILEYNCRLGDPEAQPTVMKLIRGLSPAISAALEGRLTPEHLETKPGYSVCVVMASNGYPGDYVKGLPIGGLEEVAKWGDVKVFHAGTAMKDGKVVTAGGRVIGVTALRDNLREAQERAYEAVHLIDRETTRLNNRIVFIYRPDIADKGLAA